MAIIDIVELPNKILRQKAEPIQEITDEIRNLAKDMAETMYDAPGIGLAANQVGRTEQIVVMDVAEKDQPPNLITMINPEITPIGDERLVMEEGCLSIPGVFEEVKRPSRIEATYTNLEGEKIHLEAEGILAVCIQHETDHLNGVLFVDHLSPLKRKLALRRMERFKKERDEQAQTAANHG